MNSVLSAATATPTPAAQVASGLDMFWSAWGTAISVAGIIVGAIILRVVLHFIIRHVVDQVVNGVKKKQRVDDTQALQASPLQAVRIVQRTRTLGSVLNNVVTVVIVLIAATSILSQLNVSIVGIVSAAGVIAAGLAFGAQSVVKDMLSGLFMVFEDQLGVGDIVDVGLATGIVETVGIRVTQVRDVNGTLWFVPNGQILRVGNMSQGPSRVIIDLSVPHTADIEMVQDEMLETAMDLSKDGSWRGRIVGSPELWGLESITPEAVVLRIVTVTRNTEKDNVARELRMRLKRTLDRLDIDSPGLSSIVLTGFDEATFGKGAKPTRTSPVPTINRAPHIPRTGRPTPSGLRHPTSLPEVPPTTPRPGDRPATPPHSGNPS